MLKSGLTLWAMNASGSSEGELVESGDGGLIMVAFVRLGGAPARNQPEPRWSASFSSTGCRRGTGIG